MAQTSCKEKVKTSKQVILEKNKISEEKHLEPISKNWKNKVAGLRIFPMDSYEKMEGHASGFIPLTEDFYFNEHKDTPVIAKEFLGTPNFKEFHTLDEIHRARFLKIIKVKETDTVFIYNYKKDQLSTFLVKNLPLMAHISIYGAGETVLPSDYLIGFDLEKQLKFEDTSEFYESFVSIGQENPFNKSQIKPMIWKISNPKTLPKEIKITNNLIKTLHEFQLNDLNYYLINKVHLIVVNNKLNKIIYEKTFVEDESGSLSPLNIENVKNDFGYTQWTGTLFKNKPPVVFGFMYASFGCESIYFIDQSKTRIYISCDNRH